MRHPRCSICTHEARAAIEDALVDAGYHVVATAKAHHVSRQALHRHLVRGHIADEIARESEHRAKLGVGRAWRRLGQRLARMAAALDAAYAAGPVTPVVVALEREHSRLAELEMRALGILKPPSVQVDATIGLADIAIGAQIGDLVARLAPEFPGIEDAVLRLLPPEPSVES